MKIINLGILAHVDAGKTTVTEGLLVHSGAKRKMGRVDDGTTTTDSMSLEQQRGMTIRASTVSFTWQDTKFNLIDTPGHMDFIAEVERSLSVLDGVILVISAREGVQPQTRVIFEKLRALRIPAILFINKIDRTGVSLDEVYTDIRNKLTEHILPMQHADGAGTRELSIQPLDIGQAPLYEQIIELDDGLLNRYLQGETLPLPRLFQAIREKTQAGALYPVFLGAALRDVGITPLLDAVTQYLAPKEGDPAAPLSAYVYKIEWDRYGRKWAYFRVFRGEVCIRTKYPHPGHEEALFVRGLMAADNGGFTPTGCIPCGDIGVLMDAPHIRCGDFIGEKTQLAAGITAAEPLLSVGITPPPEVGRPALLSVLQRLAEEDPFLSLAINPQTEEITLRLYGALQREIIHSLLLERYGIDAQFSPLMTLYREKPRGRVFAEIRLCEPGNLHEAGIALTLEPLPTGSGNQYETRVSFGDLTKTFQNAVEEGIMMGIAQGLGNEIVDTKAIFVDMDYSSVTSTPADYRRLAPIVVKKALEAADLYRLEPWLAFTLTAPSAHQKKVLLAVNQLRAIVQSIEYGEEEFIMTGEAPLDTTKDFAAALLSMTQGQGVFSTEFLAYREVQGGERG